MSKILLILIFLTNIVIAQQFAVTPEGLRDGSDPTKTYVVLPMPEKSPKELYDNAMAYIIQNYKNPDNVIKGKIDSTYLKFVTYVPGMFVLNNSGAKIKMECTYTTELSFKPSKVKFEVSEVSITGESGGYPILWRSPFTFKGYAIYNDKGDLKRQEAKSDIEFYFNQQITAVKSALNGTTQKVNSDW